MLPDYVDRIKALNVDHVTITINMVDPAIGAKRFTPGCTTAASAIAALMG
jgi:MoaA/NifB/PqqE/SkfB family radical SAM enzyme